MILTCVVTTALLLSLCGAAPLGDGLEVLVDSSVSVLAGHSATLPCWLNPPQSALDFEVQWYHGDHQDSSVMVYKDNKIQNDARNTTFDGRVSFGKKEAASGGLASGDVSLKLLNVTLGDAGKYTCYVSGDQDYDKATVTLTVSKTGGPVRLSAVWRGNHTVNVSCESGGWHPEPRLQWRDPGGNVLIPETPLKHSRDPSGLVSVHSWLLVSSSSEVSCSVGLDGGEVKEASVRMDGLNLPGGKNAESLSDSGPSVAGWVAFALLLIAVLAALGVLLFRRRAVPKNRQPTEENTSGEAEIPLLPVKPTDHNDTKKSFVNVTFANTGNRYLTVGVDRCTMRDSQEAKSLTEVTCLTATTGTTGFSSGQHYWEVSMKMENVDVKRSWWLGVTRAKTIPLQSDAVPTASDGFWFLSSSSDHFHFSTEPQVLLPVPCRPETVGVYLDCDTGELSFYNVEEKSLIGSLTVAAGHELYPLFNPGLGDQSSMRLIRETIKEPDTNNSGV